MFTVSHIFNMVHPNNTDVCVECVLDGAIADTESYTTLSDEATVILQYLLFTVLCQGIDIFGVGSVIVNTICFIKQGFKDQVNVSLLGITLAISIKEMWISIDIVR